MDEGRDGRREGWAGERNDEGRNGTMNLGRSREEWMGSRRE